MTNKTNTALFVISLVVAAVIGVALYINYYFLNVSVFLTGVKINGIEVQGKSPQEASIQIEDVLKKKSDTYIEFYYQDAVYKTTFNEIYKISSAQSLVEEVWDKEKKRVWYDKLYFLTGRKSVDYPIVISYRDDAIKEWGTIWQQKWDTEAKDARIEIGKDKGLVIIPEKMGLKIDTQLTLDQLPKSIEEFNSHRYAILSHEIIPQTTTDHLKGMGEIASHTTWYNAELIDRSHNLVQATQKINAYMLEPKQLFSFNDTVGKRLAETGFRDAPIIINGKFEPGMGGGICQVSSTLYNAVLLAGMEIVERHNHALAVAYVPLGRDAAVAYGLQDFRFKNSSDYPLYIYIKAGQGKLLVTLYGDVASKRNIDIVHQVEKVIEFKDNIIIKDNLQPGTREIETKGQAGYQVRSFRVYYDDNKNELKREQLARDYYHPLDQLVYVGPDIIEIKPVEPELPDEKTEPEVDHNLIKEPSLEEEREAQETLPYNTNESEAPASIIVKP